MRGASLWQPLPWVFSQTQGPCSPNPLTLSCFPSLPLTPLTPWASLGLPGSLGPSWGLRKPWEPSQAFGSLGSSVILRGSAFLAPAHPLTFSHSLPLSLPGSPWTPGTFLGPQEALGAFTSLRQPWVFSETQGPCFPCSPSPPLAPSCSLSRLSLPGFAWAPGTFLGPQEDLGAFASLWQPWVFSETQGPCFPCSLSPPEAP